MSFLIQRPRRNRKSLAIRSLVRETVLSPSDFVYPIFIVDGSEVKEPIDQLKGLFRLSADCAAAEAKEAWSLGIRAVALFPAIDESLKDTNASESVNSDGLVQRTVAEIKSTVPEMLVITDVAMDPYSSDGHDGLVSEGEILNDPTLEILANMAISQAEAGADFVAPSDMMDGRIGYIRRALDHHGLQNTGIISYAAKYCSALYGPFRSALQSEPKEGDKQTYQMDPANVDEALREVKLDVEEGADIVMVKPAIFYLDAISKIRDIVDVPVAAYNVSGEYAMIEAAASAGVIDREAAIDEMLVSIKRAGAQVIFSYFAKEISRKL